MRFLATFAFAAATTFLGADEFEFPGWQGLRVIKAENGAYKMTEFQEKGRRGKSLLLVESRQSRLEIYRHVDTEDREAEDYSDIENPNYLPMAEDFEKEDIPLERLPQIAEVYDLDGDGADEILYIQADPRKLVILSNNDDGDWKRVKEWEVSGSDLSGANPILVRPSEEKGTFQILLSFVDGIQSIDYGSKEVEWVQPRERNIERNRWWLTDLDGDGDEDLIEARNSVESPVRWYEADGGILRPGVSISEDITTTNVARLVRTSEGPKLVLLGANQANTLSFYTLGQGESSAFGKRNLLPIANPISNNWVSVEIDGQKAILELAGNKPLLKLYVEEGDFWKFENSFPILKDVKEIISVGDAKNTVILWSEKEAVLYSSHWDGERFTFPRRMNSGDDAAPVKETVIALGQYGSTTWWVSKEKSELSLTTWGSEQDGPERLVFPDLKDDFEDAVWLGGNALLLKKKFAKNALLARLEEGKAVTTESRFGSSDFRRIQFFEDSLYMAEEGVVQKLDASLEVVDQIMLEGDHSIRSFAPVAVDKAYALEDDGEHLHLMEPDEAGIFRSVERFDVPYALEVVNDGILGVALINTNAINLPSEGSSTQIEFETAIDPNENSTRDYDRFAIGTLFVVDIDGDGLDEIAVVDYGRKDIIIYGEAEEGYEQVISWKVYDDGKYPYGNDTNNRVGANPYRMIAMEIDGDEEQDLVLASHDRILIYLAKEED